MANVLIVIDGSFRFAPTTPRPGTDEVPGTPDFTYITLVNALTSAGHRVRKANRVPDSSADDQPFTFTSAALEPFDVLWLIGWWGRNSPTSTGETRADQSLGDAEIAAIADFMEKGGGVFATGDHDSVGAAMCGRLPRIRAMRSWYGINDTASLMPAGFPRNSPSLSADRADTTRRNPLGNYELAGAAPFVWFENQSDSVPQAITPTTSPAHPILRRGARTVTVFPDHMHEGKTDGALTEFTYPMDEFPRVEDVRELPQVIATGETVPFASRQSETTLLIGEGSPGASDASTVRPVNILSVYEGRPCGKGRIVTGATFHHYVDINLTGDSFVRTLLQLARTGPDAAKDQGFAFAGAEEVFADIKAVFVNITNWLARPPRAIRLILERSTFSQNEATLAPDFDGAILVTVDGLKPSQFPDGGITPSLTLDQLARRAPTITLEDMTGVDIRPTNVTSDAPGFPDRLQRFTFTYRVRLTGAATGTGAFAFPGTRSDLRVDAALSPPTFASPLTDSAFIQLVKSANPYMLDLANGNTTPWLSSDVRVFPVVADGAPVLGRRLGAGATPDQAREFLRRLVDEIMPGEFEALPLGTAGSGLSAFPETTVSRRRVYNMAIARVRLGGTGAPAPDVRVFFRVFPAPTTAGLIYRTDAMGVPVQGYRKSAGPAPIALPGLNPAGTEWISFPCFAERRRTPPELPERQTDGFNVRPVDAGSDEFFGALLDNNLMDFYLPRRPGMTDPARLSDLMMGEHQCLVAQVEYPDTPIHNDATPFTSDKLAQRNLVVSAVANPGLDASRMALHTFEIEATPEAIGDGLPPDELLLDWLSEPPEGTEVRLHMPGWNAEAVVALADRFYACHEIRALDAHTVALPGGGIRYVPIPQSIRRETGVIIADLPLGVTRGQHFDLAVRQISNRSRHGAVPQPKAREISKEEAAKLIQSLQAPAGRRRGQASLAAAPPAPGVYDLGNNRVLITDLRVLDASGDHAVLVEHPDPEAMAAAARDSARWRETIGAFQLAIPVSVKADMLPHHLRLLSVLRWRAEGLRPNDRWYASFLRYVELIAEKVRALGGDPWKVPTTPDGSIALPGTDGDQAGTGGNDVGSAGGDAQDPWFEPGADDWLGSTSGLDDPRLAKPGLWSGKVAGLLFDHFGDFEGFILEAYDGDHLRFFSREEAIRDLADEAWRERHLVTVITVSFRSCHVRRLLIRG